MLSEVQAEVAARPADTAFVLLLDFDGTLAEFNPDPDRAGADAGALGSALSNCAAARRLARHRQRPPPRRSARAARACPIMSTTPGLHGLEIEVDGDAHRRIPIWQRREARVEGLAACLKPLLDEFPAAYIEDKSASVAVHARPHAEGHRTNACLRAPMCCGALDCRRTTSAVSKATR